MRGVPPLVRAELERSFQLLETPGGAEGLVSMLTEPVGAELMDRAGQSLRVIANYAVGYDNVDLEEATRNPR
jgi:glyoxylate reductase